MRKFLVVTSLLFALPGCANPDGTPSSIGYTIFYSQADHLKALIAKQDYAGAVKLYADQEKYFTENQAKLEPVLNEAAAGYNAMWRPMIEDAIARCSALVWPSPRDKWAEMTNSLSDCRNVARSYDDRLMVGNRRAARIADLQQLVSGLDARLQADAPALLKREDLASGRSFFADYPVPLAIAPLVARQMKEGFDPRDDSRFFRIAAAYAQEAKADAPLKDEMAREVQEILRLKAKSAAFHEIVSLYKRAAELGIAPAAIPVSVGIYTASVDGAPFPVSIERDLPFDWRPMSSATAPTDADFVIAVGPSRAALNRKVGDYKKVSSTYLAGYQEVLNPAYQTAILNLQRAQQMLANARADQIAASQDIDCTAYGCQRNQSSQIVANYRMQQAINAFNEAQAWLQRTPRTIQRPVSEPYEYETAIISSTKHVELAAFVARSKDRTRAEGFTTVLDPARDFTVAYKVNAKDLGSGKSQAYEEEASVDAWEKQPISARLTELLANGTDQRGTGWQQLVARFDRRSFTSNLTQPRAYAAAATVDKSADRRFDSVVVIKTADGLGSGFYVTADTILTNAHVVEGQSFVKMKTYGGEDINGKVVASDPRRDLALVKTEHANRPIAFSQKQVAVGGPVEVVGHPRGLVYTLTRGVVSQLRTLPPSSGIGGGLISYVQLDAAISPGNSGGPVYQDGAVIGVASWKVAAQGFDNLNFAVHRDEVTSFLRQNGIAP